MTRFPEKIVFVVERHRAIGGAVYRPGLPMNGLETYRAKYVYDPATNSIDELTSEEESVGTFVDNDALASEFFDGFPITVTRHADGKVFTIKCSGLCDHKQIVSGTITPHDVGTLERI